MSKFKTVTSMYVSEGLGKRMRHSLKAVAFTCAIGVIMLNILVAIINLRIFALVGYVALLFMVLAGWDFWEFYNSVHYETEPKTTTKKQPKKEPEQESMTVEQAIESYRSIIKDKGSYVAPEAIITTLVSMGMKEEDIPHDLLQQEDQPTKIIRKAKGETGKLVTEDMKEKLSSMFKKDKE